MYYNFDNLTFLEYGEKQPNRWFHPTHMRTPVNIHAHPCTLAHTHAHPHTPHTYPLMPADALNLINHTKLHANGKSRLLTALSPYHTGWNWGQASKCVDLLYIWQSCCNSVFRMSLLRYLLVIVTQKDQLEDFVMPMDNANADKDILELNVMIVHIAISLALAVSKMIHKLGYLWII